MPLSQPGGPLAPARASGNALGAFLGAGPVWSGSGDVQRGDISERTGDIRTTDVRVVADLRPSPSRPLAAGLTRLEAVRAVASATLGPAEF